MGSGKRGKAKDVERLKEEAKAEKKKEEKPKLEKKLGPRELVRVANTDIDGNKNLITGVKKIKGVGHTFANAIVKSLKLDPHKKLSQVTPEEIQKIEDAIKNPSSFGIPKFLFNRRKEPATGEDVHLTGPDVPTAAKFDVQKEIDLKTYRGFRHMLGQPVRGQRTRSHFRHGRVVGVLRKEIKIQMAKAGTVASPATGAAAPTAAPAKKEEKK